MSLSPLSIDGIDDLLASIDGEFADVEIVDDGDLVMPVRQVLETSAVPMAFFLAYKTR
jgi:hypothetical protein